LSIFDYVACVYTDKFISLRPQRFILPDASDASAVNAQQQVVAVRAVGLNFRDVLNVLGMYPGDPGDPGSDFAGKHARKDGEIIGLCEECIGLLS